MAKIQRELPELGATEAMGRAIASIVRAGDVVALSGELGAGKTTLVRSLARALGADERLVSSPTFVLVNEYPCSRNGPKPDAPDAPDPERIERIAHVDAYRIGGVENLEALGWDRFAREDGRAREGWLLLVEWGERIEAALPRERAEIRLVAGASEQARDMEIELPDAWNARAGVAALLERSPAQCAISGRWVPPTSPTYPFADERERLADLHRWLSGGYVVGRDAKDDESA